MFINSREVETGSSFNSTVCIIGGGVAGISIALELKKHSIDVCVLESGGFSADNETRDLYRGENIGLPYIFSDGCRSRFLGGSSNCWGGWCAPMDAQDFQHRDWVNESGWPISLEDLHGYYKKSQDILHLGPYNYDPSFWQSLIHNQEVKRITGTSDKIVDKISQFSAPIRMGVSYREQLNAKNLRLFLHANVTDIVCGEDGNKVSQVKVATLKGNAFTIKSQFFILATGGIENARLLLSSNTVHTNGLGNAHDLVGRYFMDHPRLLTGNIVFKKDWSRNRLYDIKYNYHSPVVSALKTSIASQLSLSAGVQQQEGLLNARVSFSSVFPGEGTTGALALWRCKQAVLKKNVKSFKAGKEIFNILSNPIDTVSYGITRFYRPRSIVRNVNFQIIIEQAPNAQSRITLGNKKDKLGMRRVNVNWQTGNQELHTVKKTLSIISNELITAGIANKIELDKNLATSEWPMEMEGTWHHMGTTRMHDSPRKGVVDKNCKVHGIDNLFVAGSSVFPTGGANFPTITLTALALRTADFIINKINSTSIKVSTLASVKKDVEEQLQ